MMMMVKGLSIHCFCSSHIFNFPPLKPTSAVSIVVSIHRMIIRMRTKMMMMMEEQRPSTGFPESMLGVGRLPIYCFSFLQLTSPQQKVNTVKLYHGHKCRVLRRFLALQWPIVTLALWSPRRSISSRLLSQERRTCFLPVYLHMLVKRSVHQQGLKLLVPRLSECN